jgi:hypothetical protein
MLPLLKKAGVVDSGGAGLIYIFEGMLRSLCGKELTPAEMNAVTDVAEPAVVSESVETWQDALVPEDELGYGYDVQFLMRGSNLNIDEVRAAIQAMGWSTLVVGDNSLIKVHVHVHNPGEPLSYAINYGASLDDIVVENMQAQYEQYVDNRAGREAEIRTDIVGPAPIVVASGDGLKQLFMEAGAAFVIAGGQTMNPSTGDFLDVINLLPNPAGGAAGSARSRGKWPAGSCGQQYDSASGDRGDGRICQPDAGGDAATAGRDRGCHDSCPAPCPDLRNHQCDTRCGTRRADRARRSVHRPAQRYPRHQR